MLSEPHLGPVWWGSSRHTHGEDWHLPQPPNPAHRAAMVDHATVTTVVADINDLFWAAQQLKAAWDTAKEVRAGAPLPLLVVAAGNMYSLGVPWLASPWPLQATPCLPRIGSHEWN